MRMQITATTDEQHLGHQFDSNDNSIVLTPDFKIYIDRTMPISDGVRFISSSCIIDARKV